MAHYKLELDNTGWMGDPSRGAALGRVDQLPQDTNKPIKLHLTRLRWVDGDYDHGGNYWGRSFLNNNPRMGYAAEWIYCAEGESPLNYARLFVRATSREDAKAQIRARLPHARFYR